jgi:hypothetical protein
LALSATAQAAPLTAEHTLTTSLTDQRLPRDAPSTSHEMGYRVFEGVGGLSLQAAYFGAGGMFVGGTMRLFGCSEIGLGLGQSYKGHTSGYCPTGWKNGVCASVAPVEREFGLGWSVMLFALSVRGIELSGGARGTGGTMFIPLQMTVPLDGVLIPLRVPDARVLIGYNFAGLGEKGESWAGHFGLGLEWGLQ